MIRKIERFGDKTRGQTLLKGTLEQHLGLVLTRKVCAGHKTHSQDTYGNARTEWIECVCVQGALAACAHPRTQALLFCSRTETNERTNKKNDNNKAERKKKKIASNITMKGPFSSTVHPHPNLTPPPP